MRRRLICGPLDARAQGRRHGVGGPGAAHRLREEPPDQGFEPLLHPGLLRGPPDVRGDGDDVSSNLCGALDFSKVDDVCGRLETRDVLLQKAAHDARCAHRGPGATPRIELSEGLFSRLRGA